jgi:predicted dehydrogenase
MGARVEKSIVVTGATRAAAGYLDTLRDFPELVPLALVEADERRARRPPFAELLRCGSVDELLRRGMVPDVAIVCSGVAERPAQALLLLRAGVDLIVESPIARGQLEAEQLLETAERAGRELTSAVPLRVSPALLRARQALRYGAIGELRFLETSFCDKRDARDCDPEQTGGGAWMEQGPDALDVLELLAGPVRRIRMTALEQRQGADAEDEAQVETDHGGGLFGRATISWNEARACPLAVCHGERGEIVVGRSQTVLRTDAGDRVLGAGHDEREARCALVEEHLRRRIALEPPIETGPDTVFWLESAYASQRDGAWRD